MVYLRNKEGDYAAYDFLRETSLIFKNHNDKIVLSVAFDVKIKNQTISKALAIFGMNPTITIYNHAVLFNFSRHDFALGNNILAIKEGNTYTPYLYLKEETMYRLNVELENTRAIKVVKALKTNNKVVVDREQMHNMFNYFIPICKISSSKEMNFITKKIWDSTNISL